MDEVTDFLKWKLHWKHHDFPDENIFISVEFEVGGHYEDWGFVVTKRKFHEDTQQYTFETISTGFSLKDALEEAKKVLDK
jgi:hypothetical protein